MKKKSKKVTKATMLILLACALVLTSLRTLKVTADVALAITPTSGIVGTVIGINATIETENGFYVVRWDNTSDVTTGYAVGFDVQTQFTVPQTAGSPEGREILIELIDNTTTNTGTATFELTTSYYTRAVVPSPPLQLQEGADTTLLINITGGESNTTYSANITVKDPANNTHPTLTTLNTNASGYGEKSITYSTNFTTAAHTNYTGSYTATFNGTLATNEFSIGLTNATEYVIFQTVNIRASNYTYPAEHAWVNITFSGETVFSQNVTSDNGLIETNWEIPVNASVGIYMVTVINSTTPGTHKPISDTQEFLVEKPIFTVQVRAENLNNEPVSQISIEAHNETAMVERTTSNATGVAKFLLEMDNYTFKALLNGVEVGVIYNSSIIENKTGNKALILTCQLTNIKMLVIDSAGSPMPFISLAVNHTYTTTPLSFTTNYTGIWNLRNTFTNISYEIEARRSGHSFNQTHVERMPIAPWFNITMTLPTHTASIHVVDSKNDAAEGVKVEAYEWTMGVGQPDQSSTTSSDGDVSFILTFGKYRIRAYKSDILLNETTIDLVQNQSFTLHLAILNVDLKVAAIDYFGQPIPNVLVKVERKATTESMEDNTGPDGSVTFSDILGGDSRISIYIRGQLSETRELYLANSKQVVLHLNRYIVIAGYAMETSQFVTIITIAILIVIFILGLTCKRLHRFFEKRK